MERTPMSAITSTAGPIPVKASEPAEAVGGDVLLAVVTTARFGSLLTVTRACPCVTWAPVTSVTTPGDVTSTTVSLDVMPE